MTTQIKNSQGLSSNQLGSSPGLYVWTSFLVALVILGGYALFMSFINSMEILEFDTNVPWETMVSNYVFLVGSSVGLCLVSSLGYVFGLERYEMIAKRALFLALITFAFGLASITLHLGHPERSAIYGALTPNLRSAMAYMGILYPPYMAFIAFWYWVLARAELAKTAAESEGLKAKAYKLMALEGWWEKWEAKVYRLLLLEKMGLSLDSHGVELRWARVMGVLALIFALLAYTVEGSLFSHVEARPLWYGPLFPIDFLLGASFCGLAWLMSVGIITYKVQGEEIPADLSNLFHEMGQILAVLLSLGFLFTVYKMAHGLFEPAKAEIIRLFLNGPFSLNFWVFEIAIGMVFPVIILLYATRRNKITGILVASIMVLLGYFVKKYDFVVASQVYPLIKKPSPLSSYLPSFVEVLLISGLIGGLLLAYTLGVTFLPMREGKPRSAPRVVTK